MHCCGQQSAACSRLSVNLLEVISKLASVTWYCLGITKKFPTVNGSVLLSLIVTVSGAWLVTGIFYTKEWKKKLEKS